MNNGEMFKVCINRITQTRNTPKDLYFPKRILLKQIALPDHHEYLRDNWFQAKEVPMPMDRRDFLRRTGKAAALAAITGGAALLFHNRAATGYQKLVDVQSDFSVASDPQLPRVVLCRNEDHIRALQGALDGIGGIGRFISSGDRVVLKPNIGWDRTPEQAANTNPVLVAEMVRLCLSAGAASVIVTDVTCNHPQRTFIRSGIREQAEAAGARVELVGENDFITTDLGGKLLEAWPVIKHILDCDKLINIPIVKHHVLSQCTVGMKNYYGIIGGPRNQLHQSIDQSIVDLALFAKPTLTVIDATRVLMRNGPTGGSLDDVEQFDTVLCVTDQVAGDSRACEFLGLNGADIGHIALAASSGLGKIDYQNAGYHEVAA